MSSIGWFETAVMRNCETTQLSESLWFHSSSRYGMWNIYDSTINILVQLHHIPALLSFPCNCLPAVPLTFWLTSGSSEVTDVVTEDAQVCGDKLKGRSGEEAQYLPQWPVLVFSSSLCCRRTGCAAGPHTKAQGVSLHPLSKKSTFIWRLLYHPYLIFDPDATDNVSVNNFCPDPTFISLLGVFLGFFSLKLRCKTLHMCNLS